MSESIDLSQFERTANSLNDCKDPEELLRHLAVIHRDLNNPINKKLVKKLREINALKVVEHAITYHNQKSLINVALSILGNCCLFNRQYAYELCHKRNFFNSLENLLKKFPNDNRIFGKSCRIIGNICRNKPEHLLGAVIVRRYPGVIECIVNYCKGFIENRVLDSATFASISMVLRCFRNFVYSCKYPTAIQLLRDLHVLRTIGAIFNEFCANWRESNYHKNLILLIIATVKEYVKVDPVCSLEELANTDEGNFFHYLSEVLQLAPRKIVSIFMNLQKCCKLKSDLPIREICDQFNELLDGGVVNDMVTEQCGVYLICYAEVLEHPANVFGEDTGKCLPKIIKILADLKEPTYENLKWSIFILNILIKFQYSKKLLAFQLEHNIIDIVSEKLKWLVGDIKTIQEKHKLQRKRRKEAQKSLNTSALLFPLSPPLTEDENYNEGSSSGVLVYDLNRKRWLEGIDDTVDLPYSCGSLSPCSSTSSDFLSNPGSSNDQQDSSDSDDYSPVCSDNEFSDKEIDEDQVQDDVLYDLNEPKPKTINQSEPTIVDLRNMVFKKKFLSKISDLLKIYCRFKPVQLFSTDFLKRLLKCCLMTDYSGFNSPDNLISPILFVHEHFMCLLQDDFIMEVFHLTQSQHSVCSRCKEIQKIAGSVLKTLNMVANIGSNEGKIIQVLLKEESIVNKRNLILYIPYVIRGSLLTKLMLNYGGLEVLLSILKLDDNDIRQNGIRTICFIAGTKLKIPNSKPVDKSGKRPKMTVFKYEEPTDDSISIVTFSLDDGSILKANKDFLTKNSDFFSKMLLGQFKESTENVVNIQDAGLKPLSCILQLINEIAKNPQYKNFDLDFGFYIGIEDLLEAIALCDRFLLEDLCLYLISYVEKFRISSENVPNIYKWAIESHTNFLRIESVVYALVEKVNDRTFKMFNKILQFGFTEQLIEDIHNLLARYFSINKYDF